MRTSTNNFADSFPRSSLVASGMVGSYASSFNGTGAVYELERFCDWRATLQRAMSMPLAQQKTNDSAANSADLRSPADHLMRIKEVLKPTISDLASVFGVSRQSVYKWIGGVTPDNTKIESIKVLSSVADTFEREGVDHASSIIKMKAFDGKSLMDLVRDKKFNDKHLGNLMAEVTAMKSAYSRSGVESSTSEPSDDWRSSISIPGSIE